MYVQAFHIILALILAGVSWNSSIEKVEDRSTEEKTDKEEGSLLGEVGQASPQTDE